MHSSIGRHFPKSVSNRNLSNFFESNKHPNTPVTGFIKSTNDKNIEFFRYLGYGTIALGILVITVTIVFLPFLFASLDFMEANIRSNGDIFKAKSNTLWSQMQSLKRNIYRRSIDANPDSLALLNLLPKGFIPFPFQKFRIKSYPPSISPHNFKELLTKEITKLFDEILSSNSSLKTFNDPISSSIKVSDENQVIISSNDENEYEIEVLKKLLKEFKESDKAVMEKITEMEILESMKNAFKLAEQEEKERQGENDGGETSVNLSENFGGYYGDEKLEEDMNAKISLKTTFNNSVEQQHTSPSSFSQNYSYENNEQTSLSNSTDYTLIQEPQISSLTTNIGYEIEDTTKIDGSFVPTTPATVKEKMTTMLLNNYRKMDNEINPPTNIPITQQTPYFTITDLQHNPETVNNFNENLFKTENIIYIESPEDEQKCMGDPGEPGNDGYDGADGLPGLNGLPGDDGEKLIYGDICNC